MKMFFIYTKYTMPYYVYVYIYIYIYIYGRKRQINYKIIPTSLFENQALPPLYIYMYIVYICFISILCHFTF